MLISIKYHNTLRMHLSHRIIGKKCSVIILRTFRSPQRYGIYLILKQNEIHFIDFGCCNTFVNYCEKCTIFLMKNFRQYSGKKSALDVINWNSWIIFFMERQKGKQLKNFVDECSGIIQC